MEQATKKPKFLEEDEFCDEMLIFLDNVRESGITNMFGAVPYLEAEYPHLTRKHAAEVLSYWMKTFSERHSK